MKKLILGLIFVLTGTVTVMAQESDSDVLFGARVTWGVVDYGFKNSAGTQYNYDQSMASAGGFLDLTYLRLGVDYRASVGDFKVKAGSNSYTMDEKSKHIDYSALIKIPFNIGTSSKFWLGAGALYDYVLSWKEFGVERKDKYDLNDWYLELALGFDIGLSSTIALCPSLNFGYNLTPKMVKGTTTTDSWTGYKMDLILGIALKI